MNEIKYSEFFGRYYDDTNAIRIVITKQFGLYIKHRVMPVDIKWEKETLAFYFNKDDTKHVYDLWCDYKLT